jgi:hypothetical protein
MASRVEERDNVTHRVDANRNPGAVLLTVLGVILVLAGAIMLLYLGTVVVSILKAPDEVKLVALVFDQVQKGGLAFFGTIGESKFEFALGEPLRTIVFVLILLWIIGALANIIKTIIGAGRELITAGQRD